MADHQNNPVYAQWERKHNSDDRSESPWARKIIVSLDGGGVRGYSSLLILEALMSKIKDIETSERKPSHKSSATCFWSNSMEDALETKFLMHHYVDYFFGTSTGGLTAIMLGRLKLTIDEAKQQYHDIGRDVFRHRRPLTRGLLSWWVPRLSSRRMDESMKKVTAKKVPESTTSKAKSLATTSKRGKVVDTYIDRHAADHRMRDNNPYSSRTVVVACSSNLEPYFFRSYDHPSPAPALRHAHRNAGPASEALIWEVGRATSAAPGWFSPILINNQLFEDGGMSGYNNPVKIAYKEVEQLSQEHEPRMIISIGTNSKEPAGPTNFSGNEQNLTWKSMRNKLKRYKENLAASHETHKRFLARHQFAEDVDGKDNTKAMYFRFDVRTPFEGVHLCDWRGAEGAETRDVIMRETHAYLQDVNVSMELKRCAQHLVDIRRKRAKTERWEAFALGDRLHYLCPEAISPKSCGRRFGSRCDLRQHAFESHGFARQIACIHHTVDGSQQPETKRIEWTCFRDDCEETVMAFDHGEDFTEHFKKKHNDLGPRIEDEKELEQWLDRGRHWDDPDGEISGDISRRATMNGKGPIHY